MQPLKSNVIWAPIPLGGTPDERVTYYDYGVSCGMPLDSFNPAPGRLDFNDYCAPNPSAVFGIRAEGDSMEPLIHDRDLLVVNHERQPVNGDVVVATIDGEHLVKVYTLDTANHTITLTPLNPRYQPLVINTTQKEIQINGVVERFIHNMKRQMEVITITPKSKEPVAPVIKIDAILTPEKKWATPPEELEYTDGIIPADQDTKPDTTHIIQKLERYFGPTFRGRNIAKTDYLPMLADDILLIRTRKKDVARLANMIYNSKAIMGRPKSFTEWYRTFCHIIRAPYVAAYRQSRVDDYAKLAQRFYYLIT